MARQQQYCRHCGKPIDVGEGVNRGVWIHITSQSRYCDMGGWNMASPWESKR